MSSQASREISSKSVSPDSRSASPNASPVGQMPAPVEQYFQAVSQEGLAAANDSKQKAQPWRRYWKGPQQPTDDGKLIVACPQVCAFGSNNGGS